MTDPGTTESGAPKVKRKPAAIFDSTRFKSKKEHDKHKAKQRAYYYKNRKRILSTMSADRKNGKTLSRGKFTLGPLQQAIILLRKARSGFLAEAAQSKRLDQNQLHAMLALSVLEGGGDL